MAPEHLLWKASRSAMMMAWVAVSSISILCVTKILTILPDGFFDAGMLLQALKQEQNGNIKPSQKAAARNKVGKKLQLMDY
jgi:hypothetical protein